MEVAVAKSINKCKFRYEEVVSDGDSKGIAAVQKLQIYEVTKFECTNHVAKRIGTALRSVNCEEARRKKRRFIDFGQDHQTR